jgi:hypothetical protein
MPTPHLMMPNPPQSMPIAPLALPQANLGDAVPPNTRTAPARAHPRQPTPGHHANHMTNKPE